MRYGITMFATDVSIGVPFVGMMRRPSMSLPGVPPNCATSTTL